MSSVKSMWQTEHFVPPLNQFHCLPSNFFFSITCISMLSIVGRVEQVGLFHAEHAVEG